MKKMTICLMCALALVAGFATSVSAQEPTCDSGITSQVSDSYTVYLCQKYCCHRHCWVTVYKCYSYCKAMQWYDDQPNNARVIAQK